MQFSENALKVLEKRYLTKDETGKAIETVDEMFRRVASHIAKADHIYNPDANLQELEEQFYQMMTNLEFLPNSPTLMNAGRDLGQLSACFVLPVEDTMEGIFDAIKNAAIIHKSGGGTGFSFSRLRAKGATVASTGGVASGPISFMKVFNAATEAVKQGGTRRGANMGILRVDHPDILDFIRCKENNEEVTNFNISVGITESFMEAVETDVQYPLIDPKTGESVGKLNAREVFKQIVHMAWTNGEPGIIFIDRLNRDNPTPQLGSIESTNPCGEQPLLPYESCNLGSINLLQMLKQEGEKSYIDYEKLENRVKLAVHFLDNVIDINNYPLKEIEEMTKSTRKIGLGIMGFADMLITLGVPYNSEEGVKLGEELMRFIDEKSKEASIKLAKERGVFPSFPGSMHEKRGVRLRNATTTTIAPTGTISIIAGTSSGIEPLFALSYFRNVMDNDKLIETHPIFEKIARAEGFYTKEIMEKVASHGSVEGISEIPEKYRQIFVTAHDVSPYWHIRMQAAFQNHVDNAVSKTINFPYEASEEDVHQAYRLAHQWGCKGITIYRDGSREGQVLNIGTLDKTNEEAAGISTNSNTTDIVPRPRPDITTGLTEKVRIGCGNLYITANYDEKGICEVFTNLGRAGGCPSQSEATSRLISIALRSGIRAESIIEQLKGIRCHSTLRQRGKDQKNIKVLSCPDAIGRTLEKVLNMCVKSDEPNVLDIAMEMEDEKGEGCSSNCSLCSMAEICNNEYREELTLGLEEGGVKTEVLCPDCGMRVEHEGGCMICRSCGFSKCG
ncbi:vitamin B12-dependent ribonucleotide reductase [Geosporobacter ferrireducens]|uniref:vitamin B12-dependent ribonucleotide reductase n=1 Tax=Geosporobacter ferrireducens TaxID=1424294 RepID=UPI00139B3E5A|nr:vitamin B12-dependent ribonucleotide reductase [Geosporobacter ferrireducens]MTI57897.1 vitamin B12-dependent ribonucleotide reductase [Geosporobacter ferrireducens]